MSTPKVQLVYFPDCPNVDATRAAIREAARLEKRTLEVDEIDVSRDDAPAWARGWGSPTVLVDGIDVAGGVASGGELCCRLYKDGAPAIDQIRARLRAAAPARERGRVSLSIVGGVAAALAASACCLIPAVLAIVGVSGAGMASSLAPWRPYFLIAAGVAVAAGFWFAYRREPVEECGCATPRSRRWSRFALWISTVAIVAIASYPVMFDAHASVAAHARGVAEVRLHVTGMDCAACTKVLARRLARVRGVATVDVDYHRGLAVVTHDGKRELTNELIGAVEDLGYEATVAK